jgi:hypothetical protein
MSEVKYLGQLSFESSLMGETFPLRRKALIQSKYIVTLYKINLLSPTQFVANE